VNVRIHTGSSKERSMLHAQRTFSGALFFLKGMLCGKKIPIVFRVYKTKLEECREIPQKERVRSSIIVQQFYFVVEYCTKIQLNNYCNT
jgi:predicted nucleic acid-binding Zn ribbon protein